MRNGLNRALVALAGGAALATGVVTVSPARVSAAGTADPVTSFTKTADVRITMRDGISLDSDEYVPDHGCPCPVILVQTPYRKSDAAVGEYNPYFPSHGYAEIVVDVRGTGSSEGFWTSFGTPEQQDSVELVKWAAHRPFSNGTLGLAGVSYSAINQFLTVEQSGTDAVKAIFPIVPMGDPYRDVVFAGGNTDTGFIPLWLGLVNGLNTVPADDAQSNPAIALNVASQHLMDVAQFAGPAVAESTLGAYESSLPAPLQMGFPDQAYDGPYYRNVAPLNRISNVKVPTFIVGGEYDLFQRSEPLLYRGMDLPASKKKLLFGPWYHGNPSADLTADDGSSPVKDAAGNLVPSTNNLALAWFDHWLKGMDNGIQGFPTTETWQIGADRWMPGANSPLAADSYQPWYLGASPSGSGAQSLYDGTLVTGKPGAGSAQVPWQPITGACSRSATQWTAGIVAVSSCDADDSSAELTGLTFTSPAMASPYSVNGPLVADLWISSTRPDTTITATLGDVRPDGTVDRVTAGSLVASLASLTTTPCARQVTDCSVMVDGVPVVPWHPYTHSSQQPLSGSPTEVMVEIFPTSLVVEPGHRLRLSLTTGDLPHQGPNLSTIADSIGGVTTVYFDSAHPSRVYLGSDKASRAAGASSAAPLLQGGPQSGAVATPNTASARPAAAPPAVTLVALLAGAAATGARRRTRRAPSR